MVGTISVIRKRSAKSKKDPLFKQKVLWTAGHFLCLICGLYFTLGYFFQVLLFFKYRDWHYLYLRRSTYSMIEGTGWKKALNRMSWKIAYKLAFLGFGTSGWITMHQNWHGMNPTWYDLLGSENFQYLMIDALWILSPNSSFYRLLPFMILSYVHLSSKDFEFTVPAGSDQKKEDKISMANAHTLDLVAYSELFVVVALLLDVIFMKDGSSGLCMTIYLSIYWLRLQFSPYVQTAVLRILLKLDVIVPPPYQKTWDRIKQFVYAKLKEKKARKDMLTKDD